MSLRKAPTKDQKNSCPEQDQSNPRSLLRFDELPSWRQDNAYILTSYLPISGSIYKSLLSIFNQVHNETVNIHTHLTPSVVFLILPFLHSVLPLPPFVPFYLGAASCLLISSIYHAVSNVSFNVNRLGNQIDYLGILALITGSFIPSIYFGFRCHPKLQWTYWVMICSIGIACGVVTVDRRFRTPAWRAWRATMYVAMGLSAVVPMTHGLGLFGWRGMEERIAIRWLLAQGGLYIFGAALYAVSATSHCLQPVFDGVPGTHTRKMVPRPLRHPGQFASDLSRARGHSCISALHRTYQSSSACA